MKRLWNNFPQGNGESEPFMINPRLGILGLLNPRKRGKRMARKKRGAAYMAWVRSHKRKSRRNPIPVGGLVVANPRRRRRSASRRRRGPVVHLVNRRHHRRHFRRNPAIMGMQIPALEPVLYAGAGYIGAHALEYFLTTPGTNADGTTSAALIPSTITGSTIGKYAVRVGCVLATAYLAKMALGSEKAKNVGIGGGVYVLTSAAKEFAPVSLAPYMASYRPLAGARMGSYRPLAGNIRAFVPSVNTPSMAGYGDPRMDRGAR